MTDRETFLSMIQRARIKHEVTPYGIDFVVSTGIGGSADAWASAVFADDGKLLMIAWTD